MPDIAAVILAAGEGKRMKSSKPKVMHEVLHKPMIDWITDAAIGAGAADICMVAGYGAQQLEAHLSGRSEIEGKFETVLQSEQLGTGHAVMQAVDFLSKHRPEDVVILYGDVPLISCETIKASYDEHKKCANAMTVISVNAADPFGYGRIIRDGAGNVRRVTEERDATPEEKRIKEINSGIYWFNTKVLIEALKEIKNENNQHEYYLTDAVGIVNAKGYKSGAFVLSDEQEVMGANDRRQLAALNEYASNVVIDRLYNDGVSISDVSGVSIGPDVRIARDVTILPGTIIRGRSTIGEGCIIGPNSLIDTCEFADNVVFNASQAARSKIGSGVTVGPFAQLRPNTVLADKVHVGNFVEVKNSNIGEGTKISHLTYIGDSDVGKRVNFGCGCVTVNYNGTSKNRTTVGDNAFIGCHTSLVAPVEVGNNAYTAAGSCITRKVPENALAISRVRQENKENWVLTHNSKAGGKDK